MIHVLQEEYRKRGRESKFRGWETRRARRGLPPKSPRERPKEKAKSETRASLALYFVSGADFGIAMHFHQALALLRSAGVLPEKLASILPNGSIRDVTDWMEGRYPPTEKERERVIVAAVRLLEHTNANVVGRSRSTNVLRFSA